MNKKFLQRLKHLAVEAAEVAKTEHTSSPTDVGEQQANGSRIHSKETVDQLARELGLIFPEATVVTSEECAPVAAGTLPTEKLSQVAWCRSTNRVYANLLGGPGTAPVASVALSPIQPVNNIDLKIANAYVRLFNEDVKAAPSLKRHSEMWGTLTLSRIQRTIARFTSFSTAPFLEWLTTMEAAAHLQYEGIPFRPVVLMSKQHEWISVPLQNQYISFEQPIPFSEALLKEKWIRAISGPHPVGLHGRGHNGNIVGLVALPGSGPDQPGNILLPTPLLSIAGLIRSGTVAFVSTPNGDLYVVMPGGVIFVKSQGRWQYQNLKSLKELLVQRLPTAVAHPLLQLALDMSYQRRGALFSVPNSDDSIKPMIPDHRASDRANKALRTAISNIRVDNAAHKPFLMAAAGADGATIISREGRVLDVACMIGEPDKEALKAAKQPRLTRFPGARSTAAWNASIFGIGIKVSEDGPISVFDSGNLIGQFG